MREPLSDLSVHYKNPSSAAVNDHDIAQEMVIELIQLEVFEMESSLHRNWTKRKNIKWLYEHQHNYSHYSQ